MVLACSLTRSSFGKRTTENNFLYSSVDPGDALPIFCHIRIANPRDQELDSADRIEAFPRLIRRGMPYGPELNSTEDDGSTGTIGSFLCSDIRRQFYTLMVGLIRIPSARICRNRQVQDPFVETVQGRRYEFSRSDERRSNSNSRSTYVH